MAIGERAVIFENYEEFKTRPTLAWQVAMISNIDWVGLFTGEPSKVFRRFAEIGFWVKSLLIFVPGHLAQEQAAALRTANRFVEFAKLSLAEQESRMKNLSQNEQKTNLLLVSDATMMKMIASEQRRQAVLRCHIFAIAAERYRLQKGQWPQSMDQLVAAKLITGPLLDPFDGRPLRWREFDHGRLVYSIGQDRIDNGGDFTWERRAQPGSDSVIRLFDVKYRGLEPLPAKPKAADEKEKDDPSFEFDL
jgi:hypothetical protein